MCRAHTQPTRPGSPTRPRLFGFLVFGKVCIALVRQIVFSFPTSSAVDSALTSVWLSALQAQQ